MDDAAIRPLLHGLCNALNAAKINAYLLRQAHGDMLDAEIMNGLDSALRHAEQLIFDFQKNSISRPNAEVTDAVEEI